MRKLVGAVALAIVVAGLTLVVSGGMSDRGPTDVTTLSSDPFVPAVISPTRGDVKSVLILDGVVRSVDPLEVKAPASGTVVALVASQGGAFDEGDLLAEIRTLDGSVSVSAPVAGSVRSVEVIVGQVIETGQPLLMMAPDRYRAAATVEPNLLYRLYERPRAIEALIDHGPAPFACPFSSLGAADAGGNLLDAPVTLQCDVPAGVRAFSGVQVRLIVTTGEVTNVLVVPVEAVSGSADVGAVTVVHVDGTLEARTITLGLTDGLRVEVRAGLADSDRILEFPMDSIAAGAAGQTP